MISGTLIVTFWIPCWPLLWTAVFCAVLTVFTCHTLLCYVLFACPILTVLRNSLSPNNRSIPLNLMMPQHGCLQYWGLSCGHPCLNG
jgi:hypothetical protein